MTQTKKKKRSQKLERNKLNEQKNAARKMRSQILTDEMRFPLKVGGVN